MSPTAGVPASTGVLEVDVLVVGAGLAGLTAARRLRDAGRSVAVVDKGRVVGGRTASRRVDGARHDQGAQFVTLRDERVADLTSELRAAGALVPWFRGAPDVAAGDLPWASHRGAPGGDGHQRFRGAPSARAPAEHLARSLAGTTRPAPVVLGHEVGALRVVGEGWRSDRDDPSVRAGALVLTAPAPQAAALLSHGGTVVDDRLRAALAGVAFDPCWTVLAAPDGRPGLPPSGAARLDGHPSIAFLCDERRKGTSAAGAVTVHSTGAWAADHLEDDPDAVAGVLLDAASHVLGVGLTARHVHRWRYATPVGAPDDPAPSGTATGDGGATAPLVLAGDAHVGGRVEGAMVSGHVAASRLLAAGRPR